MASPALAVPTAEGGSRVVCMESIERQMCYVSHCHVGRRITLHTSKRQTERPETEDAGKQIHGRSEDFEDVHAYQGTRMPRAGGVALRKELRGP